MKKKKKKNYWNIVPWASSTFIGALGLALVLKDRRVREIKSCHMHTLPCRYTNTNSSTVRLLACNFQIQIDFQFLFKNKEQGRPKKKNISAFSVPLFMAAYIEHWQLLQKKCLLGWQQQQLFVTWPCVTLCVLGRRLYENHCNAVFQTKPNRNRSKSNHHFTFSYVLFRFVSFCFVLFISHPVRVYSILCTCIYPVRIFGFSLQYL